MPGPFDFAAGHRVLVVGGAGDIGAAISTAFLDAGCEVVATGVDAAALRGSALQPRPRLTLAPLDVTDDPAIAAFTASLGRLHTLVNCAGILARFKEFEVETFQRVIDVNLTGTFRLCTACKPLLAAGSAAGGGTIVNIASMNAFAALPWIPAYCASKGGVVMLTKSLALAWAAEGIRVNRHRPGLRRDGDQRRRAARPGALRAHPLAHSARPLGRARRHRRLGALSRLERRALRHGQRARRRRRLSRRLKARP